MSKFVEMTQDEQVKTDGGFFCFNVVVKAAASVCRPAPIVYKPTPVVCYPSRPSYYYPKYC